MKTLLIILLLLTACRKDEQPASDCGGYTCTLIIYSESPVEVEYGIYDQQTFKVDAGKCWHVHFAIVPGNTVYFQFIPGLSEATGALHIDNCGIPVAIVNTSAKPGCGGWITFKF